MAWSLSLFQREVGLTVTKRAEQADREAVDGRVLRGDRSRQAIVEALYDLVRGGELEPSAESVAARAGVGVRTVFRQFADMESLFQALDARVRVEVLQLADLTPPTGELEVDLRTLVARRARVFEHMAPFRRSGRIVRHRSTFLRTQDRAFNQTLRTMVETVVTPHLAPDRGDTVEALDLLLSFDAWDRLRVVQGLSRAHAERVQLGAALSLLRAAAPVSESSRTGTRAR